MRYYSISPVTAMINIGRAPVRALPSLILPIYKYVYGIILLGRNISCHLCI